MVVLIAENEWYSTVQDPRVRKSGWTKLNEGCCWGKGCKLCGLPMGGKGANVGSGATWTSLLAVLVLVVSATGFPECPNTAQPKKKAPRLAAVIQALRNERNDLFFIICLMFLGMVSRQSGAGLRFGRSGQSE
jgi:hypothetical protein